MIVLVSGCSTKEEGHIYEYIAKGEVVQGGFKDGEMHGGGSMIYADGAVEDVYYVKGERR